MAWKKSSKLCSRPLAAHELLTTSGAGRAAGCARSRRSARAATAGREQRLERSCSRSPWRRSTARPGATPTAWPRRRRRSCPWCACRARCCRTVAPGSVRGVDPVVVVVEGAVALVPRYCPARAGWSNWTPVSMLDTAMPAPVAPMAHACGAWMASRPHETVPASAAVFGAVGRAAWSVGIFSSTGSTSATCGVAWISATCTLEATVRASFSVPPLTSTALAIG